MDPLEVSDDDVIVEAAEGARATAVTAERASAAAAATVDSNGRTDDDDKPDDDYLKNQLPPKKKQRQRRPSPKSKSSSSASYRTTAWDRLNVDRQAEITTVADRIIAMVNSSTGSSSSTNAKEAESSSSSSCWRELIVRELRLGMILDDTALPAAAAAAFTGSHSYYHNVLCQWLAALVWQTQQARKVFALLDTHGKGCVVAQDLLNGDLDGALNEDAVMEMMDAFRVVGGGGNLRDDDDDDDDDSVVLTEDDIIRIARLVNLS